jgi:PD-(D/E)XK nuclease superfamily
MFIETKKSGKLKIPNKEVLDGWSTWITETVAGIDNILLACVDGPVSEFVDRWPSFMQSTLDPKLVAKDRGTASQTTPERLYHAFLLGLLRGLPALGWKVDIESEGRAGLGFVDIRITSTQQQSAVLIELKSSDKSQFLARDADRALEQIESQNYRNLDQLNGIVRLREYGIANFHLESVVKGRYLTRSASRWVEGDDPAVIGGSGKK